MDWIYKPNRTSKTRPLLQHQIEEAQKQTHSAAEAARFIGCSYPTYKKYAQLFGIFDQHKNMSGRGLAKPRIRDHRYPLDDILAGKHPTYDVAKLRRRLISSGYIEEKCAMCGFEERRITDNKPPLMLIFKDGESTHHALDNMMLLCYNCSFLSVGNINRLNVPLIKWVMDKQSNEEDAVETKPSHEEMELTDEMVEGIREAQEELGT